MSPRQRAQRPRRVAAEATPPLSQGIPLTDRRLDLAILRLIRGAPNRAIDLAPVAVELGVDPFVVQLAVERLHSRRLLIAPFIEPGTAGGAELTEKGLRWLIEQEGGAPAEVPVALQPAKERVRAEAEAARLPRSQVYGPRRG